MTADVELLPLPEKKRLAVRYERSFGSVTAYGHDDDTLRDYARANVAYATASKGAEIEALRAEVAEWKRVAAAQAGLHDEAEARIKRLEKGLSAYQAAVNKIDDLIEYSLPMPTNTKAALYAVLANLTATIAVELTSD